MREKEGDEFMEDARESGRITKVKKKIKTLNYRREYHKIHMIRRREVLRIFSIKEFKVCIQLSLSIQPDSRVEIR